MLGMLMKTKRTTVFALMLVALVLAGLAASGCGGGPAGGVSSFMGQIQSGKEQAASELSYDKYSFNQIKDALGTGARTDSLKVVSVSEEGSRRLRRAGYQLKGVPSVANRLAGPRAGVEARYKPLLDAAASDLSDVQLELATAKAQLAYAKVPYGANMPQYYAEQKRIAAIQPRVRGAQSKFDTLNAQKQAELVALTSTAEQQYKTDKAAHDKALAAHSVSLPAATVTVELVDGKSTSGGSFVLAWTDGTWKPYSFEAK